jgi:hypothetical protein
LAVECHGAIWSGGRHARGQGIQDDINKRNALALQGGWRQLDFTTKDVKGLVAVEQIKRALGVK